jgi:hypothetical protein
MEYLSHHSLIILVETYKHSKEEKIEKLLQVDVLKLAKIVCYIIKKCNVLLDKFNKCDTLLKFIKQKTSKKIKK